VSEARHLESSGDPLIADRREQLRNDPEYQERVKRVQDDAARGVLPPRIPVEYLVGAKDSSPDE
jgi:hypothetical protein